TFPDNDLALEWCEEQLLENTQYARAANFKAKPSDYLLFKNFSRGELEVIQPLLQPRAYKRGQKIISAGADAHEVFFLARGRVSVFLPGDEGRRLATFSPGMSFGEMAFIDGARRSADIVADTDVECYLLKLEDFQTFGRTHPALKIKLLEQLCLDLTGKLRKANREMSVFE
ncbi:MAG TPA: cyclic nucleotide-binding domain-containing protein, partial [Verrucomicrobiae bacterium]|nr:cyclic nucleotide-binding domain-containing protein [Verrucomicrobiae bacterium]